MGITGSGNLFIDERLIIDLSTGSRDYGLEMPNVRTVVRDLKAGQVYNWELRMNYANFTARGNPFLCWGAIRLAGACLINESDAIQAAAQLAKTADGMLRSTSLCSTSLHLFHFSCNSSRRAYQRVRQGLSFCVRNLSLF